MLKKKIMNYIFIVFFLAVFGIGLISIIKAEEKATNIVMSIVEENTDVVIVEGQIEKSIELGTKDYQRKGTYFLVISSVGLIQTYMNMRKKIDKL